MIKVENLSYAFPQKDLYADVSFTIEDGQHCALIGSNGTGKTTLVDMLLHDDKYMYDGKIIRDVDGRYGYVSQCEKPSLAEGTQSVYEYLAQEFLLMQKEIEDICKEMETAEELDELLEKYQILLDEFTAVDGDNHESNIKKQLKLAGLTHLESLAIGAISGGEYKLVQVIRQMLKKPSVLVMDEPDVFLDFENLSGLCDIINSYDGTLLVITHNRYLLNRCFDKILHLEDTDIQEFDGSFIEYNFYLLAKKVELQEQSAKDQEEIERNQKIVDKLRLNATRVTSASRGKALHARVSYLERLEARKIKAPFVELRQPRIVLPDVAPVVDETHLQDCVDGERKRVLCVQGYTREFEDILLDDVSFEIFEGEKVALVGPNGTGKTTLLRDIYRKASSAITIDEEATVGFLSQFQGEVLCESNTIYEEFEGFGFDTRAKVAEYLKEYCFEADVLGSKIETLSGGEKNLLQLAKIAATKADFLLLDEPTSHLDTYSQIALEKAIADYAGTVLMVSHDFYTIVNCADYILFVDDKSVRKMRIRSFRKMIYDNHFNKDYLELEQKKKELELRIEALLKDNDYETAKEVCEQLEAHIKKMEDHM